MPVAVLAQDPQSTSEQAPEPAAIPAGCAEEDTRLGRWTCERLEKSKRIEPRKLVMGERAFLWIEQHVMDTFAGSAGRDSEKFIGFAGAGLSDLFVDYRDYLSPQFGSIRTGSGISTGVHYRDEQMGHTSFGMEVDGAVSLKRYQLYRVRMGSFPWSGFRPEIITAGLAERPKKLFLYSDIRYEYFPQEDFFGLGHDSLKHNGTDFLLERASYSAVAGVRPFSELTLALRTGFSQLNLAPGGDPKFPNTDVFFTEEQAPGLVNPTDFFEVSTAVLLDYRDAPGNPHKGLFFGFSFQRFDDVRRGRFDFHRLSFDSRAYLPLGSPQRVLALQFLTSLDEAHDGAVVPFYLQETLGGSDTLRGFANRRFRGENLLYLSAEYRWEAAPPFELAVFYDTGKTFMDEQPYRFDHLEKSLGFGLRFKTEDTTFLRIDVARSEDGTQLHFTVGHPF